MKSLKHWCNFLRNNFGLLYCFVFLSKAKEEQWKQRLFDEQRKCKEAVQRAGRERASELDTLALKLQLAERERDTARVDLRKVQRDASAAIEERDRVRAEMREAATAAATSEHSGDERRDKTWRSSQDLSERRLKEALATIDELK